MDPGRGKTDDLAALSRLDETILLEELRFRYAKDKIYTYVGDIVVAVNPYKSLPIYGREQLQKYRNVARSQNPPHIYAVADATYQQMMATGRNQCCVISGESGAGKTESCKFIVAELIELSHGKSVLEQKILQVNPLLEAFGNAMTVMNDNSSRFGKYLQIKFKNGHVTGAKINEYLLEKSRVVFQNSHEQNYHIFYCMFAGLDPAAKARLKLTDPNAFQYLCEGASCLRSHLKEKQQQFEEVQNGLDLVGFETEFQNHIYTCLATVLHLGNIKFSQDDSEFSHILEGGSVQTAAELIGLNAGMLADTMTVSVSVTRGETIRKHLNKEKAEAARDALAKALYDRVFRWIVNRINQLLAPTAEEMVGETEIGILDIFGFEKFDQNSFEQICINLANEQLQYFFNEHIFTLEKQEYQREGISMTEISFQDNKPLLDMFLGRPVGLLSLLDEQSSFPKATDANFVTKINQAFSKLPFYVKARGTASGTFSIRHYAGQVEYDSWGFLEKNRDSLPSGAVELLQTSNNDLIKLIFLATLTRTGTLAVGRLTSRNTGRLRKKTLGKPPKAAGSFGGKALTVGAQFKNSLQVLIEKMNAASPHFVRCIKPNTAKAPNNFQNEYVSAQLRYTGMLETTRIRKEGYAFRPLFAEFVERYRIIAASPTMAVSAANCRKILQAAKLSDFQVGKTKVFLKYWHVDRLAELLEKVHQAATMLQKIARGFVQKRKFKILLAAKREQERKVAELLSRLTRGGDQLYARLKVLNRADESRPKAVLSAAPEPAVSPKRAPQIPAPSDINAAPPEPKLNGDSDEDEEDDVFDEDGDRFVAPSRNARFRKFGKEGTKNASVRWFKETQAQQIMSPSGALHDWFHGIITRRQAEQLLTNKPNGTFIIRVSESRFGYSLSFRVTGRCKHYMISQLENAKYVIVGEPRVHGSLEALVQFHKKHAVNMEGDLLTLPCGQSQGEQADYNELIDVDDGHEALPPVPPRKSSSSSFDFGQHRPGRRSYSPQLPPPREGTASHASRFHSPPLPPGRHHGTRQPQRRTSGLAVQEERAPPLPPRRT